MNSEEIINPLDLILVTGATGFIGPRVIDALLDRGFCNLRCLIRPSSRLEMLNEVIARHDAVNQVEFVIGDLLSRDICHQAAADVSVVYHLAAGVEKTFAGAFMNSALATRNLVETILQTGQCRRFVNISSFAVYSNLHLKQEAVLDESCPLENAFHERHDPYGFGKLCQEKMILQYGDECGLPYVILRPGMVFGPGRRTLSGRIGLDLFGIFLHMGGSKCLPSSYVDNCAEAIVLAGLKPGVDREVFNVVDDDLIGSGEFLRQYKKRVGGFFSLKIPYPVAMALCRMWQWYSNSSKGQLPPVFNPRRCSAEWKKNGYSNQKLRDRLGWRPRVPLKRAMDHFLAQFNHASA